MASRRVDHNGKPTGENQINGTNYNESVRKQREVFSKLDTALSVLEILPSIMESDYMNIGLDAINGYYGLSISKNSVGVSTNALGFLFSIIKTLGVSEETLRKWIVEILTFTLPTVEIGVKAALLSNIKQIISCSADPRIPIEYRKNLSESILSSNVKRGINIPIDAIDPNGILELSPFTEPGILKYFGCVNEKLYNDAVSKYINGEEEYIDDFDGTKLNDVISIGDKFVRTAKLARAEDFNAFLWFVKNVGSRKIPHLVTETQDGLNISGLDKVTVWKNNKGEIYQNDITEEKLKEWENNKKKVKEKYDSVKAIIEAAAHAPTASPSALIKEKKLTWQEYQTSINHLKKDLYNAYKTACSTKFKEQTEGSPNVLTATTTDENGVPTTNFYYYAIDGLTDVDFGSSEYTYYHKEKENPLYMYYDFPEEFVTKHNFLGVISIKPIINNNSGQLISDQNKNYVTESTIVPGDLFYNSSTPGMVCICLKNVYDKEGNVIGHVLAPLSSDWFSCNWYVDKSNYYASNLGIKDKKIKRDYNDEKAILSLSYNKRDDENATYINVDMPDYFNLTILPKPYIMLPSVNISEELIDGENYVSESLRWRPVRLLFDASGQPTQSGKFSFRSEHSASNPPLTFDSTITNGTYKGYDVYKIYSGSSTNYGLTQNKLLVHSDTGKYFISGETGMSSFLVECYPGLTVYEFNYDYIMGMKLFDPKVVCQQLFENSVNPRYNSNFSLTRNKLKDKNRYPYFSDRQRLLDIVINLLNKDDEEINDCFYSFSNEEYDAMLEETEKIKYNEQPFNQGYNNGEYLDFSKVNDILSIYPENGTLEEQKFVIDRALEQACATFDEIKEVKALEDSSTVKLDFLTDILGKLTMTVVDCVLSPKVFMMLMVNEVIMGKDNGSRSINTEDLIKAMKGVIKGVVNEVRDLVIQKLMDFIMATLMPMAMKMQSAITVERNEYNMAILKLLFGWFNIGLMTATRVTGVIMSLLKMFRKKHKKHFDDTDIDLPSVLDTVEYADIYDTIPTNEIPKISSC